MLHPLYMAIRDYLEIDPRIKVLNERCRVFLDLAEILSDTVADSKMSVITWIIIVLIVISIIVTVTEVGLRFGILRKSKDAGSHVGIELDTGSRMVQIGDEPFPPGSIEWKLAKANITVEELRQWGAGLSDKESGYLCGSEVLEKTFAGV